MKLSELFSTRPNKKLGFSYTQFGHGKNKPAAIPGPKFKVPTHKGRSILGFKRNRPVA